MIKKYVFGMPLETGAVVFNELEGENGFAHFPDFEESGADGQAGPADAVQAVGIEKYFSLLLAGEGGEGLRFIHRMGQADMVYGLGENVRGINKRGWIYESLCSDNPNHREDTHSLYGAHNFLIVKGENKNFGIFADHPGKVIFDVGYSKMQELAITVPDKNLDFYLMEGETPEELVKELRRLTGRSYIPPKWAFGYGQSRWSYMTADEVREVAKLHRENGIPLDSIYLDIDYMERYKDFTIDKENFPDFGKLVEDMKEMGIHLVPIIDAGVKVEEGYNVYEEGVEKGYFCRTEDGEFFAAGVWPGKVHFPDMLNEEANRWFGGKYKVLLDEGIDGFWNDMNEPAIFYSESHLKEVFEKLADYKDKNLDLRSFFQFKSMVSDISNNEKDYESFYHVFHGEKIRHDKVHNLFGFYMTKAASQAFEELCPQKRVLMYSRSSYIGMHRYGGIWMGDNLSWWSHILLNIRMLPSLNMCGFLYTGADLGGFGADTTEDLLMRWLEFGIFTPLMRNHSALGTRRQEVYRFENQDAFRHIIELRYGLLPYIYSEYMKAALSDGMYARPLAFAYPEDERAKRVEDQLLIGESIMIAPVYEQNAVGRYVYLPERMKMVRFRSLTDREETVLEQGDHYIEIPLEEVVLFIRPGHILPLAEKGGQSVEEVDFENLLLLDFTIEESTYEYYTDDGYGKDFENPANRKVFRKSAK